MKQIKKNILNLSFLTVILFAPIVNANPEVEAALKAYSGSQSLHFSSAAGKKIWLSNGINKNGKTRNCTTCHGKDLTQAGKHVKSARRIEPMAPSVNPKRFSKLKKINKWFKRNCKWTFGRECSNQEKGDILTYLSSL